MLQHAFDPADLPYWIAWHHGADVRGTRLLGLLHHFGDLKAAWKASDTALAALGIPAGTIERKRASSPDLLWQQTQRERQTILIWTDPNFPPQLRHIPDPPTLLYVRGTLPAWEYAIAIIGMRAASPYGQRMARRLGRELAGAGAIVVSGAATGIDAAAHWGALESGITVAVLGCGLDQVYPAAHSKLYAAIARTGALITEMAPYQRATNYSFPRRNRLISGLSKGVIVVEAALKSGTAATVNHALEQGREVFAVPGPADAAQSTGTNHLLREGARLTTSSTDIFDELGWQLQIQAVPPLQDPLESTIVKFLASGPKAVDALAAHCNLNTSSLASALLRLELDRRVRSCPGSRYELV